MIALIYAVCVGVNRLASHIGFEFDLDEQNFMY